MTSRLRFPTLFDTLAPVTGRTHPTTVAGWRVRRGIAVVAGLVIAFGALAGCESPSPHTLLDPEAEPVRSAEEVVRPANDTEVAPHHESVNPGSGALRMPFALQGYGG